MTSELGRLARSALAAAGLVGLAVQVASCAPARAPVKVALGRADVLVVAPHPDDETLMAAGVIANERARGRRVAVAVVTNGDFACESDGFRREGETIAAMKRLGLREEDVLFLGYPDGHLEELGHDVLPPVPRKDRAGRCVPGNTTYAARGAGGSDVHTLLTGEPATYTSDSLVFDLASLLAQLRPSDVYVSHPADDHPDHAFTYAYVRRALDRGTAPAPRLHRALVHTEGCWPKTAGLPPCPEAVFAPEEDPPSLAPPLDVYRPAELLPVPAAMRSADRTANPKFQAIAEYASQTGPLAPRLSYLFAFARASEAFFPETLDVDGMYARRRSAFRARGAVRCRAALADPESALQLHGTDGHYEVRTTERELVLERVDARAERRLLRRWVLPRSRERARHAIEIAVDVRPDDGGVAEITLRRDGELLGVAIDARPLLGGASMAVEGAPPEQVTCEAY